MNKMFQSIFKWNELKKSTTFRVAMVCTSNTGKIRAHNEDNFSFAGQYMPEEHQSLEEPLSTEISIDDHPATALFDGMGGESAGEKASYIAARYFTENAQGESWNYNSLSSLIAEMNQAVCNEKNAGKYDRIGTTVSIVSFSGTHMICANLGDSPIYLFRNQILVLLSELHTNEELLKEQGIYDRKPGLTQFLGIDREDYAIEPSISSTEIKDGDLFLICSDGLTDMCSDEEIATILGSDMSLKSKAELLVKAALENGGKDNVTVISGKITEDKGRHRWTESKKSGRDGIR